MINVLVRMSREQFLPKRLSSQLIAFVCVLAGAAVLTLAVLINLQVIATAENQVRRQFHEQGIALAEGASTFMQIADFSSLEKFFLTSAKAHGVISIYLLDPGGVVLKQSGSRITEGKGNRVRVPALAESSMEEVGESPWYGAMGPKHDARYVVWEPILAGGHLGWVRLEVTRGEIDALKAHLWRDTLLVLAGSLVLIALAAFWVLRVPMIALARASSFAEALDSELGGRVEVFSGSTELRRLGLALNRTSKRLAEQHRELQDNARFMQTLTAALGEGVIATNAEGLIVYVNAMTERLLGYSPGSMLGHEVHDLIHRQNYSGVSIAREDCPIHGQGGRGVTYRSNLDAFVRSNGERFPVALVSEPMFQDGKYIGDVLVFQDITERKREEAALTETNSRLTSLLDCLQAGILFEDENGNPLLGNRAFSTIIGCHHDAPIAEIARQFADPLVFESTVRARVNDQVTVVGEALTMADGRIVERDFVPIYLFPEMPMDEDYRGHVWLYRDMSERYRTQEELRLAKDSAESSSAAKSLFLANMSHEIRTPMNAILGMTDLALATDLTPVQREYLDLVKLSAESELRIINDILDFSKIEAGRLELENIAFNLPTLLRQTLGPLALQSAKRSLVLVADLLPSTPTTVIGDSARLQQVLTNLVGNALKFTEQGEVVVTVEPGSKADHLRFSVRDTGVGIPAARLQDIFESFSQSDNSITRRFGGTGLGLTISRRIVNLMGGELDVISREGQGSTFFFEIPLERRSAMRREPVLIVGAPLILAVPNASERQALNRWLSLTGAKIIDAEDCAAAQKHLASLSDQRVSYWVIDLALDEGDRYALLKALAEHPNCRVLPLVATGRLSQDVEALSALGLKEYVTRPVIGDELFLPIDHLSGHVDADIVQACQSSEVSNRALDILVAEDNAINQRLIIELLKKLGHQSTVADNGRLAVDCLLAEPGRFDVVLMDMQMPEMDGLSATREIRRLEMDGQLPQRIPIVALTANAMAGDEKRCLDSGMDEYLTKPIRLPELRSSLQHFGRSLGADRRAAAAETGASISTLSEPEQGEGTRLPSGSVTDQPILPAFDAARALEQLGGDRELLVMLGEMYCHDVPGNLQDLKNSLADGMGADVRRHAHTIKGLFGTFAADAGFALAKQMEADAHAGQLDAVGEKLPLLVAEVSRVSEALKQFIAE